jgi:hypothetical protein
VPTREPTGSAARSSPKGAAACALPLLRAAAQVGATPEGTEKPRCLRDEAIQRYAASLAPQDRPSLPTAADPKWRFFHRVGDRPAATQFPELNAEPVLPAAFPDWQPVLDSWGGARQRAVLRRPGAMPVSIHLSAVFWLQATQVHGPLDGPMLCRQTAGHGARSGGDGGTRLWAAAGRLQQPHGTRAALAGAHRHGTLRPPGPLPCSLDFVSRRRWPALCCRLGGRLSCALYWARRCRG